MVLRSHDAGGSLQEASSPHFFLPLHPRFTAAGTPDVIERTLHSGTGAISKSQEGSPAGIWMSPLRRLSRVTEIQAVSNKEEIELAKRRAEERPNTATLAQTLATAINSTKVKRKRTEDVPKRETLIQDCIAIPIWHDEHPWLEFLFFALYEA
ncbi:unnamed protein product [Symbiodinium necroappetens]|uniref:Uncharacterized protein n=1 Tax=Symbiodinium necroappetens TaxID=1628268 RepID=A0A813BPB3_9DINO|nr:unnamed protein product [Symbiodinium necroappetens]